MDFHFSSFCSTSFCGDTLRWFTCSCSCPTYTRWWQLHTTRWAVGSIVDLCRLCFNMSSDTSSTLQNMVHRGYYASLWIGWGSYSSTATPVATCGTSTFPWMYNMFWADQRQIRYMQLWPWHYIMQARHCLDSCRLMYSMDCCSTQLSSPYMWKRISMRMSSQDTRDKLQAKISGSTAPATLPGATPETALGTSWSTTVTSSTRLNLWSTWLDTASVLLQRFLTTCE